MTTKGHNKKRNTGLLYEFLVRSISRALVDGDEKKSSVALKLVTRHFKPGTELYKEFRLINSLVRTTVSSEAVAASIIQEAKSAARAHNMPVLDREKSLLISTINKAVNDENFYDHPVSEYRIYATIQTLLNDWRARGSDLMRMAQYEDQLLRWLVTEKSETPDGGMPDENPGTSRLLMKVMMKKLNEKYAGQLTESQRGLVRAYAFSTANDDSDSIKKKLFEVRDELLKEISDFQQKNPENVYVNKKLAEARQRLEEEALEIIDDETVTRFMLYTKLSAELTEEQS